MHGGLYKFDWYGRMIMHVRADKHTGDICFWNGKLYTAVCGACPLRDTERVRFADARILSGRMRDGLWRRDRHGDALEERSRSDGARGQACRSVRLGR